MSASTIEAVDREFFPGGWVKSNFLCALGHGDPAGLFERLPLTMGWCAASHMPVDTAQGRASATTGVIHSAVEHRSEKLRMIEADGEQQGLDDQGLVRRRRGS
jgi:hypothetical protein